MAIECLRIPARFTPSSNSVTRTPCEQFQSVRENRHSHRLIIKPSETDRNSSFSLQSRAATDSLTASLRDESKFLSPSTVAPVSGASLKAREILPATPNAGPHADMSSHISVAAALEQREES